MKTETKGLGPMIASVIESKALRKDYVAKKAGISPQRLNGWLKKNDLYVNDLFRLCKALDYDFFEQFRLHDQAQPGEAKLIMQIEVTGEKKKEVMKAMGDKELYNLVVGTE